MRVTRLGATLVVGACAWAVPAGLWAVPVGTAFAYQGRLELNGQLIDEKCDFEFRLFDDVAGGTQIGATLTFDGQGGNPDPVAVTGGLFAIELDFGAAALSGDARWLEIDVRVPTGVGPYTTLAPRQELYPVPYCIALGLPYAGSSDTVGNAFSITNTGLGRAGNFVNSSAANTDAALNAVSIGSGPAGAFLNDSGGTTLMARGTYSGTAVEAETPGNGPGSMAIHGRIALPGAGVNSAGVRGTNEALGPSTYGVWGSSAGSGWGVYGRSLTGRGVAGEVTSDFGFGVHGRGAGPSSTGVQGVHEASQGEYPGVWGISHAQSNNAAGVRGEALSPDGGLTFGVHGRSIGVRGVGVRGEGDTGVQGMGQSEGVRGEATDVLGEGVHGEGATGVYGRGNASGVTGEATDSSSYGVWAIGYNGRLSQPALRADSPGGPAIFALGGRAIEGEGTEFGVRGITWEQNGVGGTFTNYADGVALQVSGRAEVDGTLAVNVLEILGGADLAERFEFSEPVAPGFLAEIDPDHPGQLRMARGARNKRVVGIVSGANQLSAGVVLGSDTPKASHLPVALSGRAWVHCDSRAAAVEPGDFLTTSDLPGYAMPVADHARAAGAIVGKAMTALAQGEEGMVLVVVNLQ